MTTSILVVDDEQGILNLISNRLSAEGFRIVEALSLSSASQCLSSENFDIVIIDIGLPDGNGLELVKQARINSSSGIIVVSGKGDITDRVLGLEIGADDYIVKPFHLRDLVARVRSLKRRITERNVGLTSNRNTTRNFCGFQIDRLGRTVTVIDGGEIYLTDREFDVLWALVENAPLVLSREVIINTAFGVGHEVAGRPIDGLISRLREKLFPDGSGRLRIRTVRGRGYQLAC